MPLEVDGIVDEGVRAVGRFGGRVSQEELQRNRIICLQY
jgi:hypothetical protein